MTLISSPSLPSSPDQPHHTAASGQGKKPRKRLSVMRSSRRRLWSYAGAGSSIASVFTIEQIEELHGRLGSAETLADYVRSLAGIGVVRYDSYVSDGHSKYFGRDGHRVISQPVHDQLSVAVDSDRKALLD